jgi:hypothetical protein
MGSLNVEKSPLAEGEGLQGLPLRAGGKASGLGRMEGFLEAAIMESKFHPIFKVALAWIEHPLYFVPK